MPKIPEKPEITYTITESQLCQYIARILNDKHPHYPIFVQGIKEFVAHISTPQLK